MEPPVKPTFKEAFLFWLKLGFISFGGPAGQISIMHDFLVEKKRWISNSKFLHALNYCMLLPGPEAQQLATYTGWLLHGKKGGLAAGILFLLPSVFILLGLSVLYVTYGNLNWVTALFNGLKPAVVAIVIHALLKIGKRSLKNSMQYIIAGLSFVAVYFLHVPFPVIILSAIAIGIVASRKKNTVIKSANISDDESAYYLNSLQSAHHKPSLKILARQIAVFILLWLIPIVFFYSISSNFNLLWLPLISFFSKAAFVTFGGAYAVLPYVSQVSVEKYHWLNSLQMLDGLALGETTPGPLVMVLAFVGFMAGYTTSTGSIIVATIALLVTVYYTFLPCFLFIFAGAPFIEHTQNNNSAIAILQFITAAVVGVILNLAVFFTLAIIIPEHIFTMRSAINCIWIGASLLALYRFKINMLIVLSISALTGVILYLYIL